MRRSKAATAGVAAAVDATGDANLTESCFLEEVEIDDGVDNAEGRLELTGGRGFRELLATV